jgi:H+/Cl- antiporter ClcA
VAAGVTSGFGSPVGAVLFSIEATAKHYEIKCLWEGIICSSFALLVFRIAPVLKNELLFEKTNFTGFELDVEMFAFVLLGVLSGVRSRRLFGLAWMLTLPCSACSSSVQLYTAK